MTDTINVPRELLERIASKLPVGDACWRTVWDLLEARTQPAQVQEAVTWDMVKHAIAAFNPSTSIFDAMHAALTAALAAAPKPPVQESDVELNVALIALVDADARIAELEKELAACKSAGDFAAEIADELLSELNEIKAAPKPPVSDELARDAARYRWLKEYGYFRAVSMDMGGNHSWTGVGRHIGKGESIDAAIDAAMAGGSHG